VTGQGTIVGDVGGTNTRLGYVPFPGAGVRRVVQYLNADFDSFNSVLQAYLQKIDEQGCGQMTLAIAAPITGERVSLTNCDWVIDAAVLRRLTGARTVHLLNDLAALALSLPHLAGGRLSHVAGPAMPRAGRKLVIGAGTGFNAACLLQGPPQQVLPAECGHMTLPVETAADLRLRDHLAQGRGRASVERALSGQGLCEVYHWTAREAGQVAQNLTAGQITEHAQQGTDALCRAATQTVLRLLATVVGDLILAYLPQGGVYLAGSVCRALHQLMAAEGFADRVAAKGRQSDLIRGFPIHLLGDDTAALIGCAAQADLAMEPVA
jgi:glucokinase